MDVSPLETLERAGLSPPSKTCTCPLTKAGAAVIVAVFKSLLRSGLAGTDIVAIVAVLLPVSFFTESGRFLKSEVRRVDAAKAGVKWTSAWTTIVSGAWNVFCFGLLSTRGAERGLIGKARQNELFVRAMVIYSITAFTLDPEQNALLQRPLSDALDAGKAGIVTIRSLLNIAGLSISDRLHTLDGPHRLELSTFIREGLLRVWARGQNRAVRLHIDNIDIRDMHALIVMATPLDPGLDIVYNRNRLKDLKVSDLVDETVEQKVAAAGQLSLQAEKALARSRDEKASQLVNQLLVKDHLDASILAMTQEKSKRKLGCQGAKTKADEIPRFAVARQSFDGSSRILPGHEHFGPEGLTLNAGDKVEVLYVCSRRGLAVVEKEPLSGSDVAQCEIGERRAKTRARVGRNGGA